MTVHCTSELISPVHRLPISMVPAMMSIVNQDTAGTALGNTYMGYLEVYCAMSCVPLHSYYYLIVGLFILTTVLLICRPHRTNPLWCGKSEHRALLPSLKATLPLWWAFEWLVLWAMLYGMYYYTCVDRCIMQWVHATPLHHQTQYHCAYNIQRYMYISWNGNDFLASETKINNRYTM